MRAASRKPDCRQGVWREPTVCDAGAGAVVELGHKLPEVVCSLAGLAGLNDHCWPCFICGGAVVVAVLRVSQMAESH